MNERIRLHVNRRYVIPGEPYDLSMAREAYANAAFMGLSYYEHCGCRNCVRDLLEIDAASIYLDLLVAEHYRAFPRPVQPAGGAS